MAFVGGARDILLAVGLCAGSAFVLAQTQQPAVKTAERIKEQGEVYLLPPPDQLKVASLGYRAALADLLWANLLVTQGLRTQERLRYSNVVKGLEAVTELDPQFRSPYLLADSLVMYQPVAAPVQDVRSVRSLLERGIRNRPLDAEIWLLLGQFVAFRAPASFLEDPAEQNQWRSEGLVYLERAVELAGSNANIAWQALGGGSRYQRAGERDAAIRFYQKVIATTEDEELIASARASLDRLLAEEQAHGAEDRQQILAESARSQAESFASLEPALRAARKASYTGLPRTAMMAMGPPVDAAACAGGASAPDALSARCARTWREWAARMLAARPSPDGSSRTPE